MLRNPHSNLHPCADDCSGIKANLPYRRQPDAVCPKKRCRGTAYTQDFPGGNRLERIAHGHGSSGLYFTHRQYPAPPGDDVEFTPWTAPVTSNDRVTLPLVPGGNEVLGKTSPRLIRARPTHPGLIRPRTATADNRRLRR